MPWTPERPSINQKLQFGLETTPGTGVAANKLLQCFDIVYGPVADVNTFTPTGRKYPSIVIENTESVDATMNGILDYNGIVYALSGVSGAATIVASGASATAKQWTFTAPLTGSVQPQTYTVEQGETAGNGTYNHKSLYNLFTELGYKIDRKAGATITGKIIAQPLQTGITLTGSPTTIPLQPSAGKQFNVYLDTTSAGLGTTQLLKVLSVDFAWTNLYMPFYPLNRANLGWTAHVDSKPTATIKLLMEADSTSIAQLTALQGSTTQFIQVNGQGLQIAADGPGAVFAGFKHNAAVKVGKPNPFQDKDGVFATEWDFTVVEDATYANAQQFIITNLLTAL